MKSTPKPYLSLTIRFFPCYKRSRYNDTERSVPMTVSNVIHGSPIDNVVTCCAAISQGDAVVFGI